ncbi:MAG TPA: hypothetical protein VHV82_13100 [Sporichthyaceae bacterium]|jgi:hypothetical protein|nr:hypothetical protein [Sporichthyaceae bacterium]
MPEEFVTTAGHVAGPGATPDPGAGDVSQFSGTSRPPGADKLIELVHWFSWGITGVMMVGVLMAAGKIAVSIQGGRGGHEGVAHLAWVAFACVVAGSAAAIVGHLL